MKDCRDCEFALYCYAEPDAWMFRTREEMIQTQATIQACPNYPQVRSLVAERSAAECCAAPPANR
jgi:hypothetical protein